MMQTMEFLATHFDQYQLIDVRSPGEFEQGHIPGAINMPLFSNEERAEIGTLYLRVGKQEAIVRGLDIVGPKMSGMVKFALANCNHKKLMIHCWRCGMRSSSVAWLLQTAGIDVDTLIGGYTSFRRYCAALYDKLNFIVLGGMTGSGKTEILAHLSNIGEQTIDLEKLANHRGSAFGALGMQHQPTTEQFSNNIFAASHTFDFTKPIWIEDESNNIGRVFIPSTLWKNKCKSRKIVIQIDQAIRAKRVLKEYGVFDIENLKQAVLHIQKRLGGVNTKNCLEALENGDLLTVAHITLNYYDKAYLYSIQNSKENETFWILPENQNDSLSIAKQLIEYKNNFIK